MNKKENRMAVRQAAQQTVIRDEQNHHIEHAATNPAKEGFEESAHNTSRVGCGKCIGKSDKIWIK